MRKGFTMFLRLAVLVLGLLILLVSIFYIPKIGGLAYSLYPDKIWMPYAVLGTIYLTAFPFYLVLFRTLQLIEYIEGMNAFSARSVQALRSIKRAAASISLIYAAGSPLFFMIADKYDGQGIVLSLAVVIFACLAVSVFASVLELLLVEAIRIKTENDLTV